MKDEKIQRLLNYDTPSVTNVVATYPNSVDICMGLYHPWDVNWYTDTSLKCMYPELGRRAGYAVTAVFGLPDPGFKCLSVTDLIRAIGKMRKPVIVAIKQDFPDNIKNKVGLAGGNMMTAFKSAGCVGLISDGPSRDIDEVRDLEIQYMLTGVTAGHGDLALKAINVPVNICGMDVAPGEIIHMDENGATKFPVEHIDEVLQKLEILRQKEETKVKLLKEAEGNIEMICDIFSGKNK